MRRPLDCPHCGRQPHEYNGAQRWHRKQNRPPTHMWTCLKCKSTHGGPDPEQDNIDQTLHDASCRAQ